MSQSEPSVTESISFPAGSTPAAAHGPEQDAMPSGAALFPDDRPAPRAAAPSNDVDPGVLALQAAPQEERFGARAVAAALEAALEALGTPAFVLSAQGSIEHANTPATSLLHADRAETLRRLLEARAGGNVAGTRTRDLVEGGRVIGQIVIFPAVEPRLAMGARVEASAERLRLTRQQARVLGLVVEGLSNRGIAATLGISVRTVETHVCAIFDKAGVASRSALVASVIDFG